MTRIKTHIDPRWPDAGTGNSIISTKLLHDRGVAFLAAAVVWWLAALIQCQDVAAADRIVLRNLKVLTDRTVASFDEDGVRLDDGSVLAWDEIEKGTVASRQAEFDALLRELGGPLYRIRQRLTTGDYEGLLTYAEAAYARYADRQSDTAYMVKQAVMWGRLAVGQREEALEPYLRCLAFLRARGGRVRLPGERRLQVDLKTGLCSELMPVWFDREAAREQLPKVYRRIGELARPRPAGAYVYYVSLALAAGDDASAARVLAAIPTENPPLAELRTILEAQREIEGGKPGVATAALAAAREGISPAHRPLALYWLGLGQLASSDVDERARGTLDLLRIPALYGRQAPDLAGAAVHQAMGVLASGGDGRGSAALRRELLERYGQTYHAAQIKAAPADANPN